MTPSESSWNNYNGCYPTCQTYPSYHSNEPGTIEHSSSSPTCKFIVENYKKK